MNIIEERDKRTTRRKIAKKEYDRMINLSARNSQKVRLLDEGAVVMANGEIDFVIKKGTLEKYLESLPIDYVGTINLGHMPFAEFPILLGTWRKSDLSLVDIGDGRVGLDVDLHLDYDNVIVQELNRAPYSLGVSAEFQYHIDEASSRELGVEVLDEIFIKDFAIVGEAGNVNSSDINLNMKGETKVTLKELNEKLGIQEEEVVETTEVTEETVEETSEEVTAEAEVDPEPEEEEATEEVAEEVSEEVSEEVAEEEDETDKMMSVMADVIEKLNAKVEHLTSEVEKISSEKAEVEKELAVKTEKETARLEKFKTLYPSLADETEPVVEEKVVLKTDGIGEW